MKKPCACAAVVGRTEFTVTIEILRIFECNIFVEAIFSLRFSLSQSLSYNLIFINNCWIEFVQNKFCVYWRWWTRWRWWWQHLRHYTNNETARNIFRRFAHMSNVKCIQLWQAIRKKGNCIDKIHVSNVTGPRAKKTLHHFALPTYVHSAHFRNDDVSFHWRLLVSLTFLLFAIAIFTFSLTKFMEFHTFCEYFFSVEHIKYFIHEKQDDVWIM